MKKFKICILLLFFLNKAVASSKSGMPLLGAANTPLDRKLKKEQSDYVPSRNMAKLLRQIEVMKEDEEASLGVRGGAEGNSSDSKKLQPNGSNGLLTAEDNAPLLTTNAQRAYHFWSGALRIYLSYKALQARTVFAGAARKQELFDALHEVNAKKMLNLCLELQGFYLKSGQYFGTRHDFMPRAYLRELSQLHDQVPPMPAAKVKAIVERELCAPLGSVFRSLDLSAPVGAASLSQVHVGFLKRTGEKVAVKVQYPHAKEMMVSDLSNLRKAFSFLQRYEINQDLVTPILELEKQLDNEFDFRREAGAMDRICLAMQKARMRKIAVPKSVFAKPQLLIMSFLEGVPLSRFADEHALMGDTPEGLAASLDPRRPRVSGRVGKVVAARMLNILAKAWGYMIFKEGLFNGDPHPGNLLLMPGRRIGLLDWGQTKVIEPGLQYKIAQTILAMRGGADAEVVRWFFALGFEVQNPGDHASIVKMVRGMFDTREILGKDDLNPFAEASLLKLNPVTQIPEDIYFVLRAIQMFRGLSTKVGVRFSLAEAWAPYAREVVAA
ncbi:unnamed protein product, partial [Heterosigma akashiwo]